MQADAALEGEVRKLGDGIDGAVTVVAGRADQGHRLVVDVRAHPVDIHLGGERIDRGPPELHPEEVAGLVEGGVGRFGFDQVGPGHAAALRRVLAVGQNGMQDAPGAAGGDQPARFVAGRRGGSRPTGARASWR